MQDEHPDGRAAATQVLSGLYEALADHSKYQSLLLAWDAFLETEAERPNGNDDDWQSLIREHFSRVEGVVHGRKVDHRKSPLSFVEQQVVPAAVLDERLSIVAVNQSFCDVLCRDFEDHADGFASEFLNPTDREKLLRLVASDPQEDPILFSLALNDEAMCFTVASRADLLGSSPTGPEALLSIKLVRPVWSEPLSALLQSAYSLTNAEIAILQALAETGNVQTIARRRQRSVRTVRTQLAQIFAKLRVQGQTELALFIATLANVIDQEKTSPDRAEAPPAAGDRDFSKRQLVHKRGQTSYAVYGDADGISVLFLQTSNAPHMHPEFRQYCRDAGLKIITPYKPGSGGTTPRTSQYPIDQLCLDYIELLDAEGHASAIIAGQGSGGVYALQFANLFPHRCDGLVLADTGVPFRSRRELMKLPRSMRRTFFPARFIPDVLTVPHRIIAADFQASASGEARVIDYFFEDSPVDQKLTRTQKKYYDITRDIISYSFENVDRLVKDVCLWASDWSEGLNSAARAHPTVFVHGGRNPLFRSEQIERAIQDGLSAELICEETAGQLMLYTHPEIFAKACRRVIEIAR